MTTDPNYNVRREILKLESMVAINPTGVISSADEILSNPGKLSDYEQAYVLRVKGLALAKTNNIEEAVDKLKASVFYLDESKLGRILKGKLYVDLAIISRRQNNYNEAIENYLKAIKEGSALNQSNVFYNIAILYWKIGEKALSVRCFEKALKLLMPNRPLYEQEKLRIQAGLLSTKIQDYPDLCLIEFCEIQQKAEKLGCSSLEISCLIHIAQCYEEQKEWIKAKETLLQAKAVSLVKGEVEKSERVNELLETFDSRRKKEKSVLFSIDTKSLLALDRELHHLEAEALKAELKLSSLRGQISPHFIFNCLTGISGVVSEGKNNEAVLALRKLANLLRTVLKISRQDFVSIEEEIIVLKEYLDLETFRRPNYFSFEFDVDISNPKETYIPPFFIQPIVENCLKHGFSANEANWLRVNLKEEDSLVKVNVIDSGGKMPTQLSIDTKDAKHCGLALIKERLSYLNLKQGVDSNQLFIGLDAVKKVSIVNLELNKL